MEILARAVGRRKEAVAQVQMVKGTGQFLINEKVAQEYLHNNTCSILSVKAPFEVLNNTEGNASSKLSNLNFDSIDTFVKVKGGGLVGQAEAIKLGIARAICEIEAASSVNTVTQDSQGQDANSGDHELRKQLKTKGYLTQDSRVKERRKYGLKKARKASQYHKR